MKRVILATVVAAGLTVMPSVASATTPPSDPDDVAAVDNPVDENDDGGFDAWGLLGLLGLLGLAGLKRRDNRVTVDNNRPVSR